MPGWTWDDRNAFAVRDRVSWGKTAFETATLIQAAGWHRDDESA